MRRNYRATEQERAIREVLTQMFEILLSSGKGIKQVRACANECVEAAANGFQMLYERTYDSDSHEIGSVLRSWHRESRYLSRLGFPKPLSFSGPNGLRKLIGRYYGPERIKEIFAAMLACGLIKKTTGSKWLPTRSYALFPHLSNELLTHLAEGVSRFVETIISNVNTDQADEVLFERSAKVRKFPADAAPEFRIFVNSQSAAFLNAVDDWMEAQADKAKKKKGRKCTTGVFTFAFMDDVSNQRPRTNDHATRGPV